MTTVSVVILAFKYFIIDIKIGKGCSTMIVSNKKGSGTLIYQIIVESYS